MLEYFRDFNPVTLALLGTIFTYGMTAIGAALVFFFKAFNKKVLNAMLGFAAGVMIAASFWSLLAPAIELAEEDGKPAYLVVAIGFLAGAMLLFIADKLIPHQHMSGHVDGPHRKKTSKSSIMLITAITLHNIPEGLAVGVAFGALAFGWSDAAFLGAVSLAIGIGIQNLPEGAAVSIPLRKEGMDRWKCFVNGQFSGMVEPIAGVLGAFAVITMRPLLPYALAFAAGAMIYVVAEELIPQAHDKDTVHFATWGVIIGFTVMMMLDVALG